MRFLINSRTGVAMTQHGGEMQYRTHSEQPLDLLGPRGGTVVLDNLTEILAWYMIAFRGRKPARN